MKKNLCLLLSAPDKIKTLNKTNMYMKLEDGGLLNSQRGMGAINKISQICPNSKRILHFGGALQISMRKERNQQPY